MAEQMTAVQCGSLVTKLGKTVAGKRDTKKSGRSSCQRHLYVEHFLRQANFPNAVTIYLQILEDLGEMLHCPVQKGVKFCITVIPTVKPIWCYSAVLLSSVKDSIDRRRKDAKLKGQEGARLVLFAWVITMFVYPENFKASAKVPYC